MSIEDLAAFASLQGEQLHTAYASFAELFRQMAGRDLTHLEQAKLRDQTAWTVAHSAAIGLGFRK